MSRPSAPRPILRPALRRLWRGTHRLQLGTDPNRAIMVELTDPTCAGLLDLLDGTRTERGVLRAAQRAGIAVDEATALIDALRRVGLVVDAWALDPGRAAPGAGTGPPPRRWELEATALLLAGGTGGGTADGAAATPANRMRRRLAAQVIVTGSSQLAVPIASALAASGVGHLDPDVSGTTRLDDAVPAGLLPADAARPRAAAAADAVRRAAPDVAVGRLRPGSASFAVLVGFTAPAQLTALSYGSRRLAHLAVAVRDGTVVVGPLVRPGQTPCLNCLDLHRLDRDPAWRAIAAQLHDGPTPAEPVAATTALAAAAYAAAEVLAHIDGGRPTTLGATVEITRPGHASRRQWSAHPGCGCRRRQSSAGSEAHAGRA